MGHRRSIVDSLIDRDEPRGGAFYDVVRTSRTRTGELRDNLCYQGGASLSDENIQRRTPLKQPQTKLPGSLP